MGNDRICSEDVIKSGLSYGSCLGGLNKYLPCSLKTQFLFGIYSSQTFSIYVFVLHILLEFNMKLRGLAWKTECHLIVFPIILSSFFRFIRRHVLLALFGVQLIDDERWGGIIRKVTSAARETGHPRKTRLLNCIAIISFIPRFQLQCNFYSNIVGGLPYSQHVLHLFLIHIDFQ